MKKPTCTLYIKMCTCTFFVFLFIPQRNAKKKKKKKKRKKKNNKKKKKKTNKKTGNSYNLIADHFHVKTASKFKFIRKRKKRFLFFFLTRVFSICPGRKSRTKNCLFLKGGGLLELPRSKQ